MRRHILLSWSVLLAFAALVIAKLDNNDQLYYSGLMGGQERDDQKDNRQSSEVSTPDELAQKASARLKEINPDLPECFRHAIRSFVEQLSHIDGPDALGLVYRDEGYVRPIIHVSVCWGSHIALRDPSQIQEMTCVRQLQSEFALTVDPHVDTILGFVDPRFCPTLREFERGLEARSRQVRIKGKVLLCDPIPQPTLTATTIL